MLGFGAIGETAIGEIAQRAPSLADPDPKTGALRPPWSGSKPSSGARASGGCRRPLASAALPSGFLGSGHK